MSLDSAFAQFSGTIGAEYVLVDTPALSRYGRATFSTSQRVLGVLLPGSVEEIQRCVEISNAHRLPLYPISRGRNWGLGSRVPTQTDSLILHLERLNRILDFSEKLGYITVEPGVTFRQVFDYLRERNADLFVSATGGPSDGSVVGNALERGDGVGPYGDRASHIAGLEVVSPTGQLVHTGFGRFRRAVATPIYPYGVGPDVTGLFIQSNFGIVTKMTLWLHPLPRFFQSFCGVIPHTAQLAGLLDAVRDLMQQDVLRGHCFNLWNGYKYLARLGRYPWNLTGNAVPLQLERIQGRRPWFFSGEVYASNPAITEATRGTIAETLRTHVESLDFGDLQTREGLRTDRTVLGRPSDDNVRSTYWRKKEDRVIGPHPKNGEPDPDRDGCGIHWLCAVFPFDGEEVQNALDKCETLTLRHGFEPNLSLCCATGRTIQAFMALFYDRAVDGEDERARACHDDVLTDLIRQGHFPYRLGIQSMNSLPACDDDFGRMMQTLKMALDPNDVLAPGRYDFREDWPKRPRVSS